MNLPSQLQYSNIRLELLQDLAGYFLHATIRTHTNIKKSTDSSLFTAIIIKVAVNINANKSFHKFVRSKEFRLIL